MAREPDSQKLCWWCRVGDIFVISNIRAGWNPGNCSVLVSQVKFVEHRAQTFQASLISETRGTRETIAAKPYDKRVS